MVHPCIEIIVPIYFQLNLLILLFVFAFFYRQAGLYLAFGFHASAQQPALIGILLVGQFVLAPYNEILSVAMNFVTRRFGKIYSRFNLIQYL